MQQHLFKSSTTQAAIALVLTLIVTALVGHFIVDKQYPSERIFLDTELGYTPVAGANISNFALKGQDGDFLFAASTPKQIKLNVAFSATADLSIRVRGEYSSQRCTGGGFNRALLSISGSTISTQLPVIDGAFKETSFSAYKDERITINLWNQLNQSCGRARVYFFEHQNPSYALFSFGLVWCLILIICLSVKASAFIAPVSALFNAALLSADASLATLQADTFVFNSVVALGFTGLCLVFSVIPLEKRLKSLLLASLIIFVFLFPLTFILHKLVFGVPVSAETIHAIMQSYPAQALEFWTEFLGLKYTFMAAICLIGVYAFSRHLDQKEVLKSTSLGIGILFIVACSTVIVLHLSQSSTASLVLKATSAYQHELALFKKLAGTRKQNSLEASLDPAFENNKVVIVVGESVNKNHMSAYGYLRETTPNIDKRIRSGEVISFSNAYSNHTHSNATMSYLLTQANQYNKVEWLQAPSILSFVGATSLKTTWLSNHRMLGGWSNHITVIAQEADRLETINKRIGRGNASSKHDGALLLLFRDALGEERNQAIFLHFYNSHVNYCNRYPASAHKFDDSMQRAYFGEFTKERKINTKNLNCYDNSIFYTDQLLEEMIVDLEAQSKPGILVYIADHSEDVFRARGHNSTVFTYDMTNIPLFIWANDAWRTQHSQRWQNLIDNKDKLFTNDLFFETMLGVLGISASSVDTRNDLSSANFSPPPAPTTLHGKKKLDATENWFYWQQYNINSAREAGIKLGAVDIDSVGHASAALGLGIDTLQIDVEYVAEGSIQLVDDQAQQIGLDIEAFLQALDLRKLKTVIVRLNNVDASNSASLSSELSVLAKKYAVAISTDSSNLIFPKDPYLASRDFLNALDPVKSKPNARVMVRLKTHFAPHR